MPKADGDPTKRNEASSSEEPVKANPATQPDDIPPVHVLEAMQEQDRKETEDLLAGFDRPARTPKQPPVSRDFVDYHLKREKSPRSDPPQRQRSQHDLSTVLVPRKPAFAWLPWLGAAAAVIGIGVIVTFILTSSTSEATKNASTTPSAATTISAATAPSNDRSSEIPPPPPPSETTSETTNTAPETTEATSTVTPPPSPSAKRDPKPRASTSATSVEPPSTTTTAPSTAPTAPKPPRDDFIRDL